MDDHFAQFQGHSFRQLLRHDLPRRHPLRRRDLHMGALVVIRSDPRAPDALVGEDLRAAISSRQARGRTEGHQELAALDRAPGHRCGERSRRR